MQLRYTRLLPMALALLLTGLGRAEDKPADLAAVPGNALGFVHVRVADLWKNDALKELRGMVEKAGSEAIQSFDRRFIPAPSSIDRLTAVIMMPERGEPPIVFVVATSKEFDKAQLIKLGLPGATEEKAGSTTFHVDQKNGLGLHVIDNKTLVLGPIDAMRQYLAQKAGGSGAFDLAVRDASKHTISAAFNSSLLPGEAVGGLPPPLQPLARARLIQLGIDLDKDMRVDLALKFADEDAAKAGEDSAKEGLKMAREALAQIRKEAEEKLKPKDTPGISPLAELPETAVALVAVGSLKHADELLQNLPLKRDGSALATSVTVPAGPYTSMLSMSGFSAALLLPAVQKVRMAAGRAQGQNNLKQMALAMHNYADTYGRLPAAAICDKNGKPLLSWRVAILPYIEQDNLYKQFHLDEPWDSEHNKKLVTVIPRVYLLPGVNQPGDTNTHYRVFYGNGAGFELNKGIRFVDITDGTSNTIMIVEASEGVPWTKPEELEFQPDKPLPPLGKQSADGFNVAMFDGSGRFISKSITATTMKALITRAGGDLPGSDFR